MWSLVSLKAENIAAFREFHYELLQGFTTLVFGNNMDNDSQGSNGSGKSALLEAISIAITGGTLREINIDEIINDSEDTAFVESKFYNSFSGETFVVSRILSRKNPQQIECHIYKNDVETCQEETKQSSVSDYNKYILSKIGLTKDDVFSNFILSKHKFKSFLSSSDKDKKETINRFSNANIIDEAIEELLKDLSPVEELFRKSELNVSKIDGSISAIQEQITSTKTEEENKENSKESRKKELESSIEKQNENIRLANELIRKSNKFISVLDDVYNSITEIEDNQSLSLVESYEKITELFGKNNILNFENWEEKSKDLSDKLDATRKKLSVAQSDTALALKQVELAQSELDKIKVTYTALESKNVKESEALAIQLSKIKEKLQLSEKELGNISKRQQQNNTDIKQLKNKIAGQISCPKCKYVFVIDSDIDVAATKTKIDSFEKEGEGLSVEYSKKESQIDNLGTDRKNVLSQQKTLMESLENESRRLQEKSKEVDKLFESHQSLKKENDKINGNLTNIENELNSLFDEMFDSAYDIVDKLTKKEESDIQLKKTEISTSEGSIATFQKSIKDLDVVKDNSLITSLEEKRKEYEKQRKDATAEKRNFEKRVGEFKEQEIRFIEFKTHLANSKIDALSQVTNEFLEQIGSDIRIRFSGFTVLKSGKIRDKISISLIRNGIDCGSFDKFSEGEKARVNLANILAMHKLTNVNCEDGKGLDLLVLDEVLDATDETGLSSIFNALNSLQITALVVSHGNIAENYPHRLVVQKRNGVSNIQ
jgi:exonuclease SbcC